MGVIKKWTNGNRKNERLREREEGEKGRRERKRESSTEKKRENVKKKEEFYVFVTKMSILVTF